MDVEAGRLLRRCALGSEAIYRVVEDRGDTVEVEVVHAPNLPRGWRLCLTARAVRAMEQVASAPAPARRPEPRRIWRGQERPSS